MKNHMGIKQTLMLGLAVSVLLVALGFMSEAAAQRGGPGPGHREFYDARYGHDRHYPARGAYFGALPRGYHVIEHHGARFFFAGGVWYSAFGPRFVVVAPPFGLIVPFLPPYYASIWIGGLPYYYANDVYYAPAAGGYMVVAPPQGAVSQTPPPGAAPPPAAVPPPAGSAPGSQVFIYPRQGQSEEQQAKDRYECHRWAAGQTGYDPTSPAAAGMGEQRRTDYNRAMGACLEGRGYTVK